MTFPADSYSTSASLIRRAKAEDADAWRRLTHIYTPLVYGWVRQAGVNSSDAADVVQEVFRSVFANLPNFRQDGPDSTFRGWLWTITRNQVRLHFRQRARRPDAIGGSGHLGYVQQLPDEWNEEQEPTSGDVEKSLVHRALRVIRVDFEDKTWQAFWRMTVEGHTAPEIAADLGMTAKGVRQAKYRVLTRLRLELSDE